VKTGKGVVISAQPRYLPDHSQPSQRRYVFAYTITVRNLTGIAIRLLERHWLLTDGNGKKHEVKGPGVVGEQPLIEAGQEYSYTSSAAFETPIGFMEGSYLMQRPDGSTFQAPIPAFRLAQREIVN
jgi:ApaG protein